MENIYVSARLYVFLVASALVARVKFHHSIANWVKCVPEPVPKTHDNSDLLHLVGTAEESAGLAADKCKHNGDYFLRVARIDKPVKYLSSKHKTSAGAGKLHRQFSHFKGNRTVNVVISGKLKFPDNVRTPNGENECEFEWSKRCFPSASSGGGAYYSWLESIARHFST